MVAEQMVEVPQVQVEARIIDDNWWLRCGFSPQPGCNRSWPPGWHEAFLVYITTIYIYTVYIYIYRGFRTKPWFATGILGVGHTQLMTFDDIYQPDAWHKTLACAGASERSATTRGIAGQLVDFWYFLSILSRLDVSLWELQHVNTKIWWSIYFHPSGLINVKFQRFLCKPPVNQSDVIWGEDCGQASWEACEWICRTHRGGWENVGQ